MKKIVGIIVTIMVLSLGLMPALPVGAGDSNVYESILHDNPQPLYPDVLKNGKVTISEDYIVKVAIHTNSPDTTYSVIMEVGNCYHRYNVDLGEITTNNGGIGKCDFNLEDYHDQILPRVIIGPYFRIMSLGKPMPEFDTAYPVFEFPNDTPGHITVITNNTPLANDIDQSVTIDMSYGNLIGYPNGLVMHDGDSIPSGDLMPGIYTITENVGRDYNLDSIEINDPSGDSLQRGRTAIVNLKPGEDVVVTFNTRMTVAVPLFDTDSGVPPTLQVGKTFFTIIDDPKRVIANVNIQNGIPAIAWDIDIIITFSDDDQSTVDIPLPPVNFPDALTTNETGYGTAVVPVMIDPPPDTTTIRIFVGISESGEPPPQYVSSVVFYNWSY